MTEWLGISWVFAAVAGLSFLALRPRRRPAGGETEGGDGEPPLVLGGWTEAVARQVPMTADGREALRQDLRGAGLYRRSALVEYGAVRAVLVIAPLIATGLLALLVEPDGMGRVLAGGLAATVLGFSLPRVYIAARGRSRARQIERGLPLAIDLLTLCLSAGQTIVVALQQAGRELRGTYPALAEELAIVEHQARLHSLEQALAQLAERVPVPEVRNLALLLIQSERLGTDTAATLQEYAASIRITIRQRAETRASRASFWMLFPSVFCLFVAAAIVLIGPTYLEFWQHRREAAAMLEAGKTTVHRTNDNSTTTSPVPLGQATVPPRSPGTPAPARPR
jgi:pilus assembly protein TadC